MSARSRTARWTLGLPAAGVALAIIAAAATPRLALLAGVAAAVVWITRLRLAAVAAVALLCAVAVLAVTGADAQTRHPGRVVTRALSGAAW